MRVQRSFILALANLVLLAGAIGCQRGASGSPAFRIRDDFHAPPTADAGWAGEQNQAVTVAADRPFRARFEVEPGRSINDPVQYGLQYRRNGGDWLSAEAHDFPYPQRELEVPFEAEAAAGQWSLTGSGATLQALPDGEDHLLRAHAAQGDLIAAYALPWEGVEMQATFRLPEDGSPKVAFLLGDLSGGDHYEVLLEPAGSVAVREIIGGTERLLVQQEMPPLPQGQWLEFQVEIEDGGMAVELGDGAVEVAATLATKLPISEGGFLVAAPGSVEFQEISFDGKARTPRLSVVSCAAFTPAHGAQDLLSGSRLPFSGAVAINLAERTAPQQGTSGHLEVEWPLVIRRFADGPLVNEPGDVFELRMVDQQGVPVGPADPATAILSVPPNHLGGTFVETPGRIGPWQASNGDLYFIMEPTETNNVFMMMKSSDDGRTWREVDGTNRPRTDDLESVDSRLVGDTIHMIHQISESVLYHTFRTSDHPEQPDSWAIRDEAAAEVDALAQMATMAVRPDGSVVAIYLGDGRLYHSTRRPAGTWESKIPLEGPHTGPQALLDASGNIHLAYSGTDGTIWHRRLLADGTMTAAQQVATGAGTSEDEFGAVLPLVALPERDEVVVAYRLANGELWERRITEGQLLTPARRITERRVPTNAVDSQQAGADVVVDGGTVHLFFIEESTGSILSTHDRGGWQAAREQIAGIRGQWVRGNVFTRQDGQRVYGFAYDAGSQGGAGMIRYAEIELVPGE